MFKRVLLTIGVIALLAFPAMAEETSTANDLVTPTLSQKTHDSIENHTHSYVVSDDQTDRDFFEFGEYVQLAVKTTNNSEVGLLTTYINDTKELTTMLGFKYTFDFREKSEDSWQ